MSKRILVEVGAGELIDKITILRIKSERMTDAAKLANVKRELDVLGAARDASLPASAELSALESDLEAINNTLCGSKTMSVRAKRSVISDRNSSSSRAPCIHATIAGPRSRNRSICSPAPH